MLEGAGGASSTRGDVFQHGLHTRAMRFVTVGGRCAVNCCLSVFPEARVGVLQQLSGFNESGVPLQSREAGAGGWERLDHGSTSVPGWADTTMGGHTTAARSHERRAKWAGRGAVVDRGQRVEAPIAPRHRLRLQKLTSDLPIVRQVVVAHLLLLVPAIVLLPHRPPVVTHLESEREIFFLMFCF